MRFKLNKLKLKVPDRTALRYAWAHLKFALGHLIGRHPAEPCQTLRHGKRAFLVFDDKADCLPRFYTNKTTAHWKLATSLSKESYMTEVLIIRTIQQDQL